MAETNRALISLLFTRTAFAVKSLDYLQYVKDVQLWPERTGGPQLFQYEVRCVCVCVRPTMADAELFNYAPFAQSFLRTAPSDRPPN